MSNKHIKAPLAVDLPPKGGALPVLHILCVRLLFYLA
jgi:hypothetical protein